MPLVRVDLRKGRDVRAVSAAVHRAMVETLGVPERDRFQVITEHDGAHLVFDPGYLDIQRENAVFVQVVLARGRDVETKQKFYARCAELLAEAAHVRREDVLISLLECGREDWSFGNGEAQYVTRPREQWK